MNKLRKLLLICLTIISVVCFSYACQEGNNNQHVEPVGNIAYEFDGETLIGVRGKGLEEANVNLILPSKTTEIADDAFDNCQNVTHIYIPQNVTKISSTAFLGCSSLETVVVDTFNTKYSSSYVTSGLEGYVNNVILERNTMKLVMVPAQMGEANFKVLSFVKSIGDYAFYNNQDLVSVEIGENVASIGKYAFENCANLSTVYYNAESCKDFTFDSNVFKNTKAFSVVVGESANKVPAYLFESASVNSISFFGSNCAEIGDYAFYNNDLLQEVVINGKVQSIGESAFENCDDLANVVIGESVKSIGKSAFKTCASLASLNYKANVTKALDLNSNIFKNSGTSELNVTIGKNVEKVPAYLFESSLVKSLEFEEDSICSEIESYAFYNSSKLTSVTLGDNLNIVENGAFVGCDNIATKDYLGAKYLSSNNTEYLMVLDSDETFADREDKFVGELHSDTKLIYGEAFKDNVNILTITIPQNVKFIGQSAFENCHKLIQVINKSNLDIALGEETFGYVAKYAIYLDTDEKFDRLSIDENGIITFGASYEESRRLTLLEEFLNGVIKPTIDNVLDLLSSLGFIEEKTAIENFIKEATFIVDSAIEEVVTSFAFEIVKELYNIFKTYFSGDLMVVGYVGDSTNVVIPLHATGIYKYAFSNNNDITSLEFEDNSVCYTIQESAFYGCENLSIVYIPENIHTIEENAFVNCNSLEFVCFSAKKMINPTNFVNVFDKADTSTLGFSLIVDVNVQRIPSYLFANSNVEGVYFFNYYAGSNCKEIGKYAFYGCENLETVTIPENVVGFGEKAFVNCGNLSQVYYNTGCLEGYDSSVNVFDKADITTDGFELYIGSNVDRIPSYLFSQTNVSAVYVDVFSEYTKIEKEAFYKCENLQWVEIGATVEVIEEKAFAECPKLSTVYYDAIDCELDKTALDKVESFGTGYSLVIGPNVPVIKEKAFFELNVVSVAFTFGGKCTEIGKSAFENCTNLLSISIGDEVKVIGANAFKNCRNLLIASLGNNVTTIEKEAFYYCIAIVEFTNGNKIEKIGDRAFYYCMGITNFTLGDQFKSSGINAFEGCSNLTTVNYNGYSLEKVLASAEYANEYSSPLLRAKLYKNGSLVTSIRIAKDITKINKYAFNGCTSINTITFVNQSDWVAKLSSFKSLEMDVSDNSKNAGYLTNAYGTYVWEIKK